MSQTVSVFRVKTTDKILPPTNELQPKEMRSIKMKRTESEICHNVDKKECQVRIEQKWPNKITTRHLNS
jgi:hypothetical protein